MRRLSCRQTGAVLLAAMNDGLWRGWRGPIEVDIKCARRSVVPRFDLEERPTINTLVGPRLQGSGLLKRIACMMMLDDREQLTIQQWVGMETVLHLTCRDQNLLGMQASLLGGNLPEKEVKKAP